MITVMIDGGATLACCCGTVIAVNNYVGTLMNEYSKT